jgi:hypothetical protein
MKREGKPITLGSGKIYIMPYTDTVPAHTDICKPANLLGYIKGGASLEYTEETYEEKDDLGIVSKIITTSEEAILKCGLLTWNGETLTVKEGGKLGFWSEKPLEILANGKPCQTERTGGLTVVIVTDDQTVLTVK